MNFVMSVIFLTLISCKGQKDLSQISKVEPVKPAPPTTSLEVDYCPVEDDKTIAETLVSFVIDESGSNHHRLFQTEYNISCFKGTDPLNKRYEEIISFIDAQEPDENNIIHYSVVPWGTNTLPSCYRVFRDDNNRPVAYSSDPEEVKHFIRQLVAIHNPDKFPDVEPFQLHDECTGWTNYIAAIEHATNIKNSFLQDMRTRYSGSTTEEQAIIFATTMFISDGEPRVLNTRQDGRVLQNSNQIFTKVLNYMTQHEVGDLSNTRIRRIVPTFNTSFYTTDNERNPHYSCNGRTPPNENIPIALLQNMAFLGNGGYYDIRTNPDYRNFKMPTIFNKYQTQQALVFNKNAVWERQTDGTLTYLIDSDGDGVSDQRELELGSNPFVADSNGNGIRDGIQLMIRPGVNPADTFHISNDVCSMQDHFRDTDLDGLTDCEEKVLGMDPTNSDEDQDGIPDGILVLGGVNILNSNHNSDVDGDGYSNIEEVRWNLPVRHHNRGLAPEVAKQLFRVESLPHELYEKDSCKKLTIDKLRTADMQTPFDVDIYFYSKQEFGNLRMLNRVTKQITPGEHTQVHPDDLVQTYFEESE